MTAQEAASRRVPPAMERAVAAEGDPDREALALVVAGDGDAFRALVERNQERLLRLCERMLGDVEEARDAAQDVFLRAFRSAASWRPDGLVSTWLYRIAVNLCLNRLRRRRVVRMLSLTRDEDEEGTSLAHDPRDERADPHTEAVARERWRTTRRALDRLPANQRAVVVLARFEGLSQRQIAEALGITEGAVESRLVRAMRTLAAAQEKTVLRVSRK